MPNNFFIFVYDGLTAVKINRQCVESLGLSCFIFYIIQED